MSETVNQENVATEKTFTQDEVNAFVGERLAREREKYADYEALKEKAAKYESLLKQLEESEAALKQL